MKYNTVLLVGFVLASYCLAASQDSKKAVPDPLKHDPIVVSGSKGIDNKETSNISLPITVTTPTTPNITTKEPNTTTPTEPPIPFTISSKSTPVTTSTTEAPNTTTSTETTPITTSPKSTPITTPITSKTTTNSPNITTLPPATTTAVPTPDKHDKSFDLPSFIGGIILSLGLTAIGYVVFKFYRSRTDPNYRSL